MRRRQLMEIHDQTWCPGFLRDAETDYLQHAIRVGDSYGAIVGKLKQSLEKAGTRRIIDLCSGGGGPWPEMQQALEREDCKAEVCLTDKYPNVAAFQQTQAISNGSICYQAEPVNATRMPADLEGFRTLFSSFHHFAPEQARAILADAVRNRQGIAIFEATPRRPLLLVLMCLTPLMVLLMTPMIRPFRLSRLLFTYLLPIIPFAVMFDGLVSCLRTYSVAELQAMTEGLGGADYVWEAGEEKGGKSDMASDFL